MNLLILQFLLLVARKEEEDYKKYKESRRLNNVCETPQATGILYNDYFIVPLINILNVFLLHF